MSFVSQNNFINQMVVDMLECFNGDHPEEITNVNAIKSLFTRHVSNTDNWAINLKSLIIFHRTIQNWRTLKKSGSQLY